MESYVHKWIFKTKSNIYNGAFFNSVKPYFKSVLNSIELLLGSIFYSPFRVKAYNCENFRRKSLLTIEQFFFKIRNYAMESCHQ